MGVQAAAARITMSARLSCYRGVRTMTNRRAGGGNDNGPGSPFVAGVAASFGAVLVLTMKNSTENESKVLDDGADVLIIGGGIIGTAVACFLTKL